MGIECGQGGLRIDKGPLQRCAYWDLGEEVCGGVNTSGPLMLSSLPYLWEVLLHVSARTHIHTAGTWSRSCIRKSFMH